jgi:hypothetical protein
VLDRTVIAGRAQIEGVSRDGYVSSTVLLIFCVVLYCVVDVSFNTSAISTLNFAMKLLGAIKVICSQLSGNSVVALAIARFDAWVTIKRAPNNINGVYGLPKIPHSFLLNAIPMQLRQGSKHIVLISSK